MFAPLYNKFIMFLLHNKTRFYAKEHLGMSTVVLGIFLVFSAAGWRTNQTYAQQTPTTDCTLKPIKLSEQPRKCRQAPRMLSYQESIPRMLIKGEMVSNDRQSEDGADCYNLTLNKGQFARIVVTQLGTDVELELFEPDQSNSTKLASLSKVDRPNLNRGPEAISVVAKQDGQYLLQVFPHVSVTNQAGGYKIQFAGLRESRLPEDEIRIQAEKDVAEAEVRRDRGTACERLEAAKLFRQARDQWMTLGDFYEAATASYGLGLTFGSLGKYQIQARVLQDNLRIIRGLSPAYGEAATYLEAANQTTLASAYLSMGAAKQARDLGLEALKLRESLGDDYGKAITLTGLGLSLIELQYFEEAKKHLEEALALRRRLEHKVGEVITLGALAKREIELGSLGNHSEAERLLRDALKLLPSSGKQMETRADLLSNLGELYSRRPQPDYMLAEKTLNDAVQKAKDSGNQTAHAISLYRLAAVERKLDNFASARSHIEEAINLSDHMATAGIDSRLQAIYALSVRRFYEFEIDLLMDRHRRFPSAGYDIAAFEVSERMHSRGQVDSFIAAEPEICPYQAALGKKTEPALAQTKPAALSAKQFPAKTTGQSLSFEQSINCTNTSLQSSGWVAAATNQTDQPLSITQVLHLLSKGDGTLLLEFAITPEHVYLWTISSTVQRGFVLASTPQEITDSANELIEMMTVTGGLVSKFEAKSKLLCRKLIPPEVSALISKHRRLVIVADGALLDLPFAVLHNRSSQLGGRLTYAPLITTHELINLPSMKALNTIRQRPVLDRKKAANNVLVFSGQGLNKPQSGSGVQPVPIPPEVEMMRKLFPAATVLPSLGRNMPMTQYGIIHFATYVTTDHSYQSPRIGTNAVATTGGIINRDQLLSLAEVFDLKLSADLVVLSACETFDDSKPRGDWLADLTKGFTSAGARHVVASLWPVPDRATVTLLEMFYQNLKQGVPAPAALRQAQIKMWQSRQWPPSDWAGFAAFGDWLTYP